MPDRVRITDVSPRDGLQNEPGFVPTADKARLVELLARTGVDEIEVTSFVSPKWVPQLADAEQLLRVVANAREAVACPLLSVLVPNEKGFERARAIHRSGLPLKIALFTAASESFSRKNTNASIAESIERFRPIIPRAIEAGMEIRLYISCAVACPFEGAIAPAAVRRLADMLLGLFDKDERDLAEIDLGDTIGVAHPHEIRALLREFESPLRGRITLHLHDTFGRAADCVKAALDMGIRSFDGSVAGLGGCPYASTPQQRAPGNIATETLVRTIHDAGFSTGVDLDRLTAAASFARQIVATARSSVSTA